MFGSRYFGTFYYGGYYWGSSGADPTVQPVTLTVLSGYLTGATP